MVIKTITCHRAYNYGASLQAFALQHYLEQRGFQVEIIDYFPDIFQERYNLWHNDNKTLLGRIVTKFPFLAFLLLPLKNRHMFKTWGRRDAFVSFEKDYMHVTAERYETIDDLRNNPPAADVYIVGSDQVWNTDMQNGRRPPFYLDFGPREVRRISYAASFGIPLVREEFIGFVKQQLQKFSHISVREKSGLNILESLGFHNAVQVLDPVFLLKAEEWEAISMKAKDYGLENDKYILVYNLEHKNLTMQSIVRKLSNERHLPVVSVNDYQNLPYADKNICNAGPLEFLSLIKHAAAFVSNSFHGTAFSIIFNKEFYVFPLMTQRNPDRMISLLESTGMEERFKLTSPKPVDYTKANVKLNAEIISSIHYLQTCLS